MLKAVGAGEIDAASAVKSCHELADLHEAAQRKIRRKKQTLSTGGEAYASYKCFCYSFQNFICFWYQIVGKIDCVRSKNKFQDLSVNVCVDLGSV